MFGFEILIYWRDFQRFVFFLILFVKIGNNILILLSFKIAFDILLWRFITFKLLLTNNLIFNNILFFLLIFFNNIPFFLLINLQLNIIFIFCWTTLLKIQIEMMFFHQIFLFESNSLNIWYNSLLDLKIYLKLNILKLKYMVFYYNFKKVAILFCTNTAVHLFTNFFGRLHALLKLKVGYLLF